MVYAQSSTALEMAGHKLYRLRAETSQAIGYLYYCFATVGVGSHCWRAISLTPPAPHKLLKEWASLLEGPTRTHAYTYVSNSQ